ncbi:LapA family protein [Pelotomaculum propionicicum]|uniref:LapA family protein n=1 Tax=Pelotomaculum propionicicum TaxID=258475 RepID=UPI003B78E27F
MSKAQVYLVAAIMFALVVAIFAVQNTEKMAIYFLFWQVKEVSKVIIILASTALGALVTLCLGFMWSYKKIKHIRLLEAELKELKKMVNTNNTGKEPAGGEHQQANC